jgi:hypothetical protein
LYAEFIDEINRILNEDKIEYNSSGAKTLCKTLRNKKYPPTL